MCHILAVRTKVLQGTERVNKEHVGVECGEMRVEQWLSSLLTTAHKKECILNCSPMHTMYK